MEFADRTTEQSRMAEPELAAHGFSRKNLFVWDRPGFDNRLLAVTQELQEERLNIIGVGLSAYSILNGCPMINATGWPEYSRRVDAHGLGTATFYPCSNRHQMDRFMVLSLEAMRLDPALFRKQFHCEMSEVYERQLRSFLHKGLITPAQAEGGAWGLTSEGRTWATTMAAEFFAHDVMADILESILDGRYFPGRLVEDELLYPVFLLYHDPKALTDGLGVPLLSRYVAHLGTVNKTWVRQFCELLLRTMGRHGPPPLRLNLTSLLGLRSRRAPKEVPV
jgi:hypothetical protein